MTRQQELALLIKLCCRLDKDASQYRQELATLKASTT